MTQINRYHQALRDIADGKNMQIRTNSKWHDTSANGALNAIQNDIGVTNIRVRPTLAKVGNSSLAKTWPAGEPNPVIGQFYHVPSIYNGSVVQVGYNESVLHTNLAAAGMFHDSQASAEEHLDALMEISLAANQNLVGVD
ncbi:hypothetical protein [Delftia phage PhiW-14]|uniref:Uncharacterized protein n=1 Tax=Delftia phage PhiW-14 TaxID=665032 RepID=C9DG73_BPW14|nr:hypothetical protein DP-phiW-14_gp103 [Delftia phage PhiW-14]ACV50124.1 hypothetical protein [Delftia phage PhiW-14]